MIWDVLFCVLRCVPAVITVKALPPTKNYILMLLCYYYLGFAAFAIVALMGH